MSNKQNRGRTGAWLCAVGLSLIADGRLSATQSARPVEEKRGTNMDIATFGAGCFWGVESAFQEVKGVTSTAVGYMGGALESPTYKDVCTDRTGHAEVVQLTYDPLVISYEKLLEIFWKIHDPTTANRQGPDVGSQYRSVVFFHTPEQERLALVVKERLQASGAFRRPVVTQIAAASSFWRAEDYHQRYFEKHGLPSCHVVRD